MTAPTPTDLTVVPAILREDLHPAPCPGVLVLPGGGYRRHSPIESEVIAHWFSGLGHHAFVLRYPVQEEPDEQPLHPAPLQSAVDAMTWIRSGAHGLNLSDEVGVIGFSAGGHLGASLSHADKLVGAGPEAIPNWAILGYPVISMGHNGQVNHPGCRDRLLGTNPQDDAVEQLSIETQVHPGTPPTFLWHTATDQGVPIDHSTRYAEALARAEVPVELHIFPDGYHGLGLAPRHGKARQWMTLAERWLS